MRFLPILFACSLLPAGACDIPVFRYALEHWPADDYRFETSGENRRLFPTDVSDANLRVEVSDTETESRLLFPDGESVAWTGVATPETAARILDSPARAEIAKCILSGQSVVWVYIESGDPAKDDAAVSRVSGRLEFIESVAELQEIDPDDPENEMGPWP